MKKYINSKYILAVLLFASVCFVFSCQNQAEQTPQFVQYQPVPAQSYGAQNLVKLSLDAQLDTLTTSGSLDTSDYDMGSYSIPVNFGVQIIADSLSGATGATAYVQSSYHSSGDYWVDVPSATATIDGVQTRTQITGSVLTGRLRVRVIAPSSTQSTKIRLKAFITEDNP